MFVAGGSNHFYTRPDSTNSSEKKLYQGARPINRNIADTFCPVNILGLHNFFTEHLKFESIAQLFASFSFPTDIEQDFEFFCTALAHQFALFIKKAPDDADDIVLIEYQKLLENPARAIVITKTLKKTDDFDDIFIPVLHSENLTTINESKLCLRHLNHSNSRFSFNAMESFLVENIVNYVQDRMTIDRFEIDRDIPTMAKSFGTFKKVEDDIWLDNELGNIIIYAFLEQILGAPKLYNKIELIASGHEQVAFSGGGVHLYNAGSDSSPDYQLVFGKANIDNDIKLAIDNAFDAINKVIHNTRNELLLIENSILSTRFPEIVAKRLANILKPQKSIGRQAQNAFGVFLGYSINLTGVSNANFRAALTAKMQSDIKDHAKYISDKIVKEGFENYSFYFYFLPFNDATIEKKSVLKNILQGGN